MIKSDKKKIDTSFKKQLTLVLHGINYLGKKKSIHIKIIAPSSVVAGEFYQLRAH